MVWRFKLPSFLLEMGRKRGQCLCQSNTYPASPTCGQSSCIGSEGEAGHCVAMPLESIDAQRMVVLMVDQGRSLK
jgi:hypothetical protein